MPRRAKPAVRLRKRDVAAAIGHYKPFLGLSDWHSRVEFARFDDGSCAEVVRSPSNASFVLRVDPKNIPRVDYSSDDDWWMEVMVTVIHELLHAMQSPYLRALEDRLERAIGEELAGEFTKALYALEDAPIERLARTLYAHLPRYRRED